MSFHSHHPFLNLTLNELVSHFNSKKWGQQGPRRVSESAKKYCDTEPGSTMLEGGTCIPKDKSTRNHGGFSILNQTSGMLMFLFPLWPYIFDLKNLAACFSIREFGTK